jgi:aspartate/methionine/tyrosine aminotransferase
MKIEPSKRLQSLPAYAFKEINDKVAALRASGVKAIDFGVGDPSEPTPDFVVNARRGSKQALLRISELCRFKEFRVAAAGYMKEDL